MINKVFSDVLLLYRRAIVKSLVASQTFLQHMSIDPHHPQQRVRAGGNLGYHGAENETIKLKKK